MVIQIDPKWCAQPLDYRNNHTIADTRPVPPSRNPSNYDPRTDSFAIYDREFGEFDRNRARKYEDLSRFIIFVSGLTSALDAEYSLQRYTGRSTIRSQFSVHYKCRIKVRTGSKRDYHRLRANPHPPPERFKLFPNPLGPPPVFATVRPLLCASFVTSHFAAFLATLRK